MTQDEIIELAEQAKLADNGFIASGDYKEELVKFFRLGYARGMLQSEKNYMQLFLDPENQPTQFGTATQDYRQQEIKDEREACAKIAEKQRYVMNISLTSLPAQNNTAVGILNQIRSRGEQQSCNKS